MWDPNARDTIQKIADEPEGRTHENFPFAAPRELKIPYFADVYPVKVEAVGYRSLYDPENIKPRS